MKKYKLFFFRVVLLAALIVSCNNKRNHLINSWKTIEVEAKTPLSDSIKNDILTNGNLSFTKDGHVTGYIQSDINNGTFALTKKGKNLVIKDETGTPYVYESTITVNSLILDNKEMKITFIKY